MDWAVPACLDDGIILLADTKCDSRLDDEYWEIAESIHTSLGRAIIFSDWLYENPGA